MVKYSRIFLSPLKSRKIEPPFNPKIEKIRGFNRLAPFNPPKTPKIKPHHANFYIHRGFEGGRPPFFSIKTSHEGILNLC